MGCDAYSEVVNPSDPVTLVASSDVVAALATLCLMLAVLRVAVGRKRGG